MNSTIIMQVDETTKGLMEKVQSGISSSIEESIRNVKDNVQNVSDNTESILKKFKNFDGISSSVEVLQKLANESKQFTSVVSPLQDEVSIIKEQTYQASTEILLQKENISLIIKSVVELSEKISESHKNITQELDRLVPMVENTINIKKIISEIKENQNNNQKYLKEHTDDLKKTLEFVLDNLSSIDQCQKKEFEKSSKSIQSIIDKQKSIEKQYIETEKNHEHFEKSTSNTLKEVGDSIEKLQATLDIVVNLVTPFWKKWGSNHE